MLFAGLDLHKHSIRVCVRDQALAVVREKTLNCGQPDTIVLALPRGGVPVAYEVARALDLPLDVFLVRKLGAPGHEELAMGALASDGTTTAQIM